MFKSWFGANKNPEPDAQTIQSPAALPEADPSALDKLKSALSQTSHSLIDRITSLGRDEVDGTTRLTEDDYEVIEETLIRADVGVDLALSWTEKMRQSPNVQTKDDLRQFLHTEFSNTLSGLTQSTTLSFQPGRLNIYLVVGVNGAGKTTLIGKLAHRFVQNNTRVIIAAADTFRAAAEDQIEVWAQRAGAELVRKDGVDAAAVVFDAVRRARESQAEVLIIDTAGRLQNKFNLMEELRKIKGIIDREAPEQFGFESLLVLDATTGQNALRQAEVFHEAVTLTGVVLTKLDGSSKGGVVFNIAREYKLPVKLVGVGEKIEDIRDFDSKAFVDALFENSGQQPASHLAGGI